MITKFQVRVGMLVHFLLGVGLASVALIEPVWLWLFGILGVFLFIVVLGGIVGAIIEY